MMQSLSEYLHAKRANATLVTTVMTTCAQALATTEHTAPAAVQQYSSDAYVILTGFYKPYNRMAICSMPYDGHIIAGCAPCTLL
jgi:hypothetical protein